VIKDIIQKLLVAIDYRVQFLRDSEDYVEVWRIQYIFPAGVHPLFLWELLAHGTAPVTAGIIVDRNTAAVFTDTDIDTECTGFAVPDVINCFSLSCREFMGFRVLRIKAVEYILNCTISAHDSPPFGSSKGLRMPRSVLLLTCRYTSVERGSTCPRRDWIYLMSTPFSNK
jgi:hypothetical protein